MATTNLDRTKDIYSNGYTTSETITVAGAIMQWGLQGAGGTNFPLIVQSFGIAYQRGTSPIYPVVTSTNGANKRLLLVGAPSGTLTINAILTPDTNDATAFLKATGKACAGTNEQVWVSLQPFVGCSDTSTASTSTEATSLNIKTQYTLRGVTLARFALNNEGGEVALITQPLQFLFTNMEFSGVDNTSSSSTTTSTSA